MVKLLKPEGLVGKDLGWEELEEQTSQEAGSSVFPKDLLLQCLKKKNRQVKPPKSRVLKVEVLEAGIAAKEKLVAEAEEEEAAANNN